MASACFTATVLGASGKAGIKFFQAGLERAGEGRPSQRQPPWRAGLLLSRRHGHPGSAALGRCQPPRAGWTDPCAAPSHPLRYPHPLPRLRRAPAPASLAPPAPGSLQSPRLPLGSLLRRPGLIPAWGVPRGGGSAGQQGRTRRGPWAPQLPTCEAARTLGAGTLGKARTGRSAEGRALLISHASHVWGHPAALSSSPPLLSPRSPVGEGKVAVAALCPGRSESRGRKWRTSR